VPFAKPEPPKMVFIRLIKLASALSPFPSVKLKKSMTNLE
jgi:hypothetical protein